MISLLSIIALGFFLGMRHATDPDHVIAVTTIVSRERSVRSAAWIGALWGLGHTLTILFVGAGIILAGWVIPVRLGLSMEFSVGLMLILLGVFNLTGILQRITESLTPAPGDNGPPHSHPHQGEFFHLHVHGRDAERTLGHLDRLFGRLGLYQMIRPLAVGIVHGLAGSAAVALLVLTTIQNPWWALTYLLVFGFGTVAGMMLITSAIAVPIAYSGRRFAGFGNMLAIASGVLSVGFGCFLAYQIGFVNGLLTDHPHWTPR